MKLTTLIILIAFMQVSAKTYSQITLHVNNKPLTEVLETVKKQTQYVFFYEGHLLDNINVSVDVNNVSLKEAISQCLKNLPLTFNVVKQNVVISQKIIPVIDQPKISTATPITISGKVLDEIGQPLQGVTVKEKGTNNGVVTDARGAYLLDVPDNNTIITFSYIGYEIQELSAKDLPNGSAIILKAVTTNLKEVVVNKGYYKTTKELNTGDVATVSAKEIEEQPVTNPLLTLEGKVAGLYIKQGNGLPGAQINSVRIRGQNSIANGNNPLYIIDGVPFTSISLSTIYGAAGALDPLNTINNSDIESIDVLKDADATAIYGSRGANGVILITTKKGKAGKTSVDVNVYSGFGKDSRFAQLLTTSQYLRMRHEAFKNDGATPGGSDFDVNGTWDTTRNTNWQKVFLGGSAKFTNAQASISGGNENTQFIINGGYSNQGTIYPGDYSDQLGSLHFNLNHGSLDGKFHISLSGFFVNDNNKMPSIDLASNILLPPDAPPIYDQFGNLNWANFTWINPLSYLAETSKSVSNNLSSTLFLSYQIAPGLSLKGDLGYTKLEVSQSNIFPSSIYPPPYNTFPSLRSIQFANNEIKTIIFEPQLSYTKKIGDNNFDAVVGATYQQNKQDYLAQNASGFSSDQLVTNIAAASSVNVLGYNNTDYKLNKFFARLGYNLQEKYILNITASREGSSRFGNNNQFGNFGAIGAAWIFSKEKLIEDNFSPLSFGKLRISYGTTGNDQITDYQYLSTYTPNPLTYQGITGLFPTRIANPYYGWELVKKMEVGLELGFFNDKVFLTASYYRNRTNNQLVGYSLPAVTGFTTIQENLPAIVQNAGTEFTLNVNEFKNKSFNWTTSFNLTFPTTKLIAYPNIESSTYANIYTVGQSLFTKKTLKYTGLDPNTGLYTFEDINHDGSISIPEDYESDKQVGQKFFGGLQNNFVYKNWELNIFFQFVKQTAYNYINSIGAPGTMTNQPTAILNGGKNSGDKTIIEQFTQAYGSDAYNAYLNLQRSDYAIGDASFIRLKNVALSYQIPLSDLNKIKAKKLRIYLQGQNLFTITKYIGDPETESLFSTPPLRMLTCGFQLTF